MIKKIRVRNFKSLRDVSVALEPVTVLIGRSGTGKSNFVHALGFLRDYLTQREQAVNNMGGWPYVLCATREGTAPELSFELEFDVPGVDGVCVYALSFQIAQKGSNASFLGESLKIANQVVFGQSSGRWMQQPDLVEPPNPGQPVLGLLYGLPEVRIAHIVLTKGIGCYNFAGNVLMHGGFNPAEGTSLKDDASNFLTVLDGIATNLSEFARMKDMLAAMQRLNSALSTVELAADRSHIRVGHKVGDAARLSFKVSQESEGFRRFLAHMMALYQQPPKQVLAFEEPENGIYPGALGVLAEYFQAVADAGRSQVIMTTHSPELLKDFAPQQIRVVTMEGYETKIGSIAAEQRESLEEHLMTADELLTVDEARIDTSSTSA